MAAYAHGYVVSIIGPSGQPIRESNEVGDRTIRLPYESEYKIRIKNKNSVRCKAQVLVDGMDIAPGKFFILRANESVDLERFLQDGDMNKGNCFRFVNALKGAATGEIQDPHSPNLGQIEVKFFKELTYPYFTTGVATSWPYGGAGGGGGGGYYSAFPNYNLNNNQPIGGTYACVNSTVTHGAGNAQAGSTLTTNSVNVSEQVRGHAESEVKSDAGGTAMGSESRQQFHHALDYFQTELSPMTISIQLKGLKQSIRSSTTPAHFVVLDPDGNMLSMVKSVNIKLSIDKHFIEVELTRQMSDGQDCRETTLVSEIFQDQHKYIKGQSVTVIRLATSVKNFETMCVGSSAR